MRNIVNISLPTQMNTLIEKELTKGRYASKSEFFRNLIRLWLEGKLLDNLEDSRQELKAGKGSLLKSLSNLR